MHVGEVLPVDVHERDLLVVFYLSCDDCEASRLQEIPPPSLFEPAR